MSNYMKINKMDIANGEGIRVSLFLSGCHHHCNGCFNKESWDFNAGQEFTGETLDYLLDLLDKDYISGLSILGGEPLALENVETTYNILSNMKIRFKHKKNVWLWTGYTIDDICDIFEHYEYVEKGLAKLVEEDKDLAFKLYALANVINYIDVLVDGRFIEEQKDLALKWRGSANQRVIDVKQSLREGEVILYAE